MNPASEIDQFEIVILGGGLAGCAAAIAAGRAGARVLLAERAGCLGGAATSGSVAQFIGWSTRAGRVVIKGIAREVAAEMQARGAAGPHGSFTMSTGHVMDRIEYDPDILKIVLDEMVVAAGADVLFHTGLAGVSRNGGRVDAVTLAAPGGPLDVSAASFVDATGDMALLSAAGADFLGSGAQGPQPATMMFAMAPVDFQRLEALSPAEKAAIIAKGLKEGALPRAALHHARVPHSEVAWFNISRVQVDAADPFSLSRSEMTGRAQALAIAEFLRRSLPGCENARLCQIAPSLGVRDARRVRGDHVLTVGELRAGTAFEDTISCGAYPIDIHHGDDAAITFEEFGADHFYRIPYRALLPMGLDNVAATGRGISAEPEAFAALRVMPSAMAMGHGAGCAAAMAALTHGGAFRDVSILELQTALRAEDAFLGN